MRKITLFLSDGQIFKFDKSGTTPVIQRHYFIGAKLKNGSQTIDALTIEN